jgi:hypothetical protein
MPEPIHANPVWRYQDARGVEHVGHFHHASDFGGTDVVYQFIDCETGELSVVGSIAGRKRMERIWAPCPHA